MKFFTQARVGFFLVQIWESLSDSLKSEVKLSEGTNANRVFTLPKNESKGNPLRFFCLC